MAIGLFQQVKLFQTIEGSTTEAQLALRQAVGWRLCVGVVLCLSVILLIGLNRGLLQLPDGSKEQFAYSSRIIPEFLLYAAMITVLIESLGDSAYSARRCALWWLYYSAVLAVGLVSLVNGLLVHALAYSAFADVEGGHVEMFRRPGAYPDFDADGYWLFWRSAAAMGAAVVGSLIFLKLLGGQLRSGRTRIWAAGVGLVLLTATAAYGYWFLLVGLPVLSPDFAEGGWAVTSWRCIEATVVVALATPVFAYRLVCKRFPLIDDLELSRDPPAFHQDAIAISAFAMCATFFFIGWIQTTVSFASEPWPNTGPIELALLMIFDVRWFMPIAVSLLCLSLAVRYMRRGELPQPNLLRAVPWSQLSLACVTLLIILAFSTPTILAFCFSWWVGPWPPY